MVLCLGTGSNEQGQLLLDNTKTKNIQSWQIIHGPASDPDDFLIVDVACCWESTTIVRRKPCISRNTTTNNTILSYGQGLKGELGLGPTIKSNTIGSDRIVMNIESSGNIQLISSMYNVLLIDREYGSIYGWGNNTKEQLTKAAFTSNNTFLEKEHVFSVPLRRKQIWEPCMLSKKKEDCSDAFKCNILNSKFPICLGKDFIFQYDGETKKICKTGSFAKYDVDKDLFGNETDVVSVMNMWSSVHVLTRKSITEQRPNESFLLKSAGNGNHGQLAMNNRIIDNHKHSSCGSEHGIICNKENQVYCWGWGEHGNCGLIQSQKGISTVCPSLNLVYTARENEEVVSVQGGCATTFISSIQD